MAHREPRCHRPGLPLGEYVDFFAYWRSVADRAYVDRALARGAVAVIIDVGARQRLDVFEADGVTPVAVPPAFVVGPHTGSYVSRIAAGSETVAVHFLPGGARSFMPVPLRELRGACVGLDRVWGGDGIRLHRRLIAAGSVAERFAILERFLVERMGVADRHPEVVAAIEAIEARPGMRIGELSVALGLSPRRLSALFDDEIGLRPKAYARIRRLHVALRELRTGHTPAAVVAAETGYFDQAHLHRELRAFTAPTPAQYRLHRIRLPNHVPIQR